MLEDKGFPDGQLWLGFTKEQDGVTWRRVLDGTVVDPDSPSDPFEGWDGLYPSSVANYDYVMSYTYNPYHIWNTIEADAGYFGCEY